MTQPVTSSSSPQTTYTTIPISAADVISRSVQNLSSAISRLRPWPELIASGNFSRPDSFPSALTRLRAGFHYFRINYSIVISACGALSLIGSPISLIVFASVFALWLLLYFFREDPLVLRGYHVNDRLVLVGLFVVSFLAIWVTGSVGSLVLGVLIGVSICGVHAVLRNSDDLAGDDVDGPSRSLIGSNYGPSYGSNSEFT